MKKIFITSFLLAILLLACSETTQYPIIVDSIYPVILSSFPSNNQLDVAINLFQIQVIFNENVTEIEKASFSVNNGVLGTISYDSSIKTAI